MDKFRTLTLVGGISTQSLNRRLFRAIEELMMPDFEFVNVDIARLPYFSQDLENDPPDIVTEYKEKIRDTDALLVITPEYNRSFPGVLKNAIDWGSRPYGHNLWAGRPAAILGASIGSIGTFGAQHHLRQVLSYLDVHVLNQPEVYLKADDMFTLDGKFKSASTSNFILSFFQAFREHIVKIQDRSLKEHYLSRGLEDSPGTGVSNH